MSRPFSKRMNDTYWFSAFSRGNSASCCSYLTTQNRIWLNFYVSFPMFFHHCGGLAVYEKGAQLSSCFYILQCAFEFSESFQWLLGAFHFCTFFLE